ncbi:ABC transporter substrate-binding protein [Chitinibacter tainanensis]|uniref:substrate-binding periplasmic protein n=1 Tax=Chitinibacter tainanensis TaxID=230667 RepID=UPI002357761B|nr:transporter substrate-binding domain-containing protein [Chitinibacter tainanensis]
MRIMTGCVLALALSPLWVQAAGCQKPLRMAVEQWPPYVYSDAQGKPRGVDIEILQAIFAEAGCSLQIGPELPRKRRQAMFIEGKIDLMLAASITPERQQFSWFTAPYRDESVSLFSKPEQAAQYTQLEGFGSILQQRIALLAPNAGWYGEDYKKHYFWLNEARLLSPFETFNQGVRMLAAGRAPLLLGDTGAVHFEAGQQQISVYQLPLLVMSEPVHFMLSKKSVSQADSEKLNAALLRLEKRGVLKKIRSQYGLSLNAAAPASR